MASFRTHISCGALVGFVLAVIALLSAWVSQAYLLPLLFLAAMLGSFLPDIDSDDSLPFQILLALFSLVGATLAFLYTYQYSGRNYTWLLIIPSATFLTVRFLIGWLLKRFTRHRGMLHSLPALLIASLGILLLINRYPLSLTEKVSIASACGLGYLSHLILDEWKSFVNFRGIFFKPKKSLGSSLKLFSRSKLVNLTTYSVLIILIILNISILKLFFHKF